MCVGRDEGLDALDVALVDLVAGVVFQVQIDLFDVSPFWIKKIIKLFSKKLLNNKIWKRSIVVLKAESWSKIFLQCWMWYSFWKLYISYPNLI